MHIEPLDIRITYTFFVNILRVVWLAGGTVLWGDGLLASMVDRWQRLLQPAVGLQAYKSIDASIAYGSAEFRATADPPSFSFLSSLAEVVLCPRSPSSSLSNLHSVT